LGNHKAAVASLSQPGKGYMHHIQNSNYEWYPWLTGSKKNCKLYCWDASLQLIGMVFGATWICKINMVTARHQGTAQHL